jgi:hypothetical protein
MNVSRQPCTMELKHLVKITARIEMMMVVMMMMIIIITIT